MNIGPSEAETFWTPFLPKLVRRGLRGIKLVVRDAHAGVKATVRKGRQHRLAGLPRPLHAQHTLAHAGESRPRVVAAFIATAFAQDDAETTTAQWCKVAEACRNLGIRHVRARALPAQSQRKGRTPEGYDRQRLFARSQTFMPNDSRPSGQTRRVPPPTPFAKISSAYGHGSGPSWRSWSCRRSRECRVAFTARRNQLRLASSSRAPIMEIERRAK